MLNLKIAEAFVDLSVQMSKYNRDMAKVRRDLGNLPGSVVIDLSVRQTGLATILRQINALRASTKTPLRLDFRVDRTRASADLNLLMQQARAIRTRAMGTIPIRADLRQWNRSMVQVFMDLHRARLAANVPVRANNAAAHSSLNLLLQHLRAVQAAANITVTGRRSGFWGRAGGGGFGGGMSPGASFLSGAAQGLGLGYASNPYMAAGLALTKLATAAAASTIALETQAAILRRIAGFTPGQTGQVKQALFGMGTSKGNAASMEDLMNMATIGARMGVADKGGVKGLVEFTQGMSKLATVIHDVPAEKLADEVGRSLNNFRLGTEYVEGFGSALMALDNVSIASASDILNITQRLGGMGHAVGLSASQVMSLASVLKDVGISNEVAGTSFSQIFQKMASKSDKFAEVIGIDTKKFEDAFRKGPLDALGLVIDKLATMDDTIERMQALDDLGLKGARVSGSLLRLTQVWDRLAQRVKLADAEFASGKALAEGVAIQAATTESAITRMKNGFREFGDSIVSLVNPALGGTADALGQIASGLASVINGKNWVNMAGEQEGQPKSPPKPPPPPPPPKTPIDDLGINLAREREDAALEKVETAMRELNMAKSDARDLRAEGNQMMAAARGPAAFDQAVKRLAQAEAAEAQVKESRQRMAKAQKAYDEAVSVRKQVEARDAKEARNLQVRQAAGALLGGKQGLVNALVGGAAKAAGNAARNAQRLLKNDPKTHERLTVGSNDLLQRGQRIQESILNREKDKEAEKAAAATAKNTGAMAETASKSLAVLEHVGRQLAAALWGQH